MNLRTVPALALGALAAAFVAASQAAEAPLAMHGSADTFAAPGMALAWAVLRGADETTTKVVIRIVTDPAVFSDVAVAGSDPFTGERQAMLGIAPSAGSIDLKMPRAHFAAFPRTELRFYAPASPAAVRTESLLVFYLGVPDTTPEFVDEPKLDAYLSGRIAQLRGNKRP